MAVRHGYGKIAGTDALVFAYDTGDTRNSYKGEPTTNLYGNWVEYTANSYELLDNGANYVKLLASAGQPWAGRFEASVSAGTYTVSFQHRTDDGGSNNFNIDNDAQDDNIWNANITTTTEWQTYTSTKTHTGTGNHLLYFRRNSGAGNIYIRNVQIELKSHATPFIRGTRSSTQGLLDLTGNSTIDISTVSFDSSAQKVFDGTDDYISVADVGISDYSQPFTMECVFMVDPAATWDNGYRSNIFGNGSSYSGMYGLNKYGGDNVGLYVRDASGGSSAGVSGLAKGVYYHLVGTWDGTDDIRIYLNGSLGTTTTSAKSGTRNTNIHIGGSRAFSGAYGNHYQGEIPVAKYYNRALTASEVANNYRQYKSRFNL